MGLMKLRQRLILMLAGKMPVAINLHIKGSVLLAWRPDLLFVDCLVEAAESPPVLVLQAKIERQAKTIRAMEEYIQMQFAEKSDA